MSEQDFAEKMLPGFVLMRNELIRHLVHSGLTDFKVLDSCSNTDCDTTASVPERIKGLRTSTATDGVHLTPKGYLTLARRATKCIKQMMAKPLKTNRRSHTFFWRGFRSTRGSSWARPGPSSIHRDSHALRGVA